MSNLSDLLFQIDDTSNKTVCPECDKEISDDLIKDNLCPLCGKRIKLITLAEYGQKLPIGVLKTVGDENTLIKDFNLKKVDFIVEREIIDSWNRYSNNKKSSPIDYIAVVLANTILSIAGQSLDKFTFDKKISIIHQMYIGDVFYMYAWLRYSTVGKNINLTNFDCINCGKRIEQYAMDMSTLEVNTIDNVNELEHNIELEDGFTLMNKLCKKLKVKPPTFHSLVNVKKANSATALGEFLKSSVIQIEDLEPGIVITDGEIQQLSVMDMSLVDEELNYASAGPVWSMEIICPHCEDKLFHVIDWTYADFFGRSSRATKRRRLRR